MKQAATRPTKKFYSFGPYRLYGAERELFRNGKPVHLQPKTLEALIVLVDNHGHVVDKEELMRRIWPDLFVEEVNLGKQISQLRKALGGAPDGQPYVETVPRRGYRFTAPVTESWEEEAEPKFVVAETVLPEAAAGRRRWPVAGLLTVVAIAAGVWLYRLAPWEPVPPPRIVPLTSYPEREFSPSFSPDGNRLSFTWCRGDACAIYVKQIGAEQPQRLTAAPSGYSAWSPDGMQIAYGRWLRDGRFAGLLIPAIGGPERQVAVSYPFSFPKTPAPYLAWFPDGKWLVMTVKVTPREPCALFLYSLETTESRQLTFPPEDSEGDTAAAVSPDGRRLVFNRVGLRTEIFMLELTKNLTPREEPRALGLTGGSPTWIPGGRDIVYVADSFLWRAPVSGRGEPERLLWAGEGVSHPAVSPAGGRMAFVRKRDSSSIWRVALPGSGQEAGVPEKIIVSTRRDAYPAYSPDGQWIAFLSERSGALELWVADKDGANPRQLTSLGVRRTFPAWSPDGTFIAFASGAAKGDDDIYVVEASSGSLRQLTTSPSEDRNPFWSPDGQWVFFQSRRGVWKVSAQGGAAVLTDGPERQTVSTGGFRYFERPTADGEGGSVWRKRSDRGDEVRVIDSVWRSNWAVTDDGIYFVPAPSMEERRYYEDLATLMFHSFETGNVTAVVELGRHIGHIISVSPDCRYVLYSQADPASTDLMLVENFR